MISHFKFDKIGKYRLQMLKASISPFTESTVDKSFRQFNVANAKWSFLVNREVKAISNGVSRATELDCLMALMVLFVPRKIGRQITDESTILVMES